MNKRFNILHVISKLPVGGVENMLLKIVTGYDRNRFNVGVCCISEGGEIADKLKQLGYKVDILDNGKLRASGWRAVKGIYSILKRDDVHILRTHQYHANMYGRIAGKLAGVPVIIPSFHNLYASPDRPKFHRRIVNHLLGYISDSLVAVSNAVASDIKRYDLVRASKIKTIYNGVETGKFSLSAHSREARLYFGLPIDPIIIGSVGRLTVQKGYSFLLEAASSTRNTCIAIAGDGPLRDELGALAERNGVKCILLGRVPPDKIPYFLSAIDVFCFPSLWEGSPSALMEAMAAGLPVVASDIPPHREVVGQAGILVPSMNRAALAEALNNIAQDTALRDGLGAKAKDRSTLFAIENTVKAYEELFTNVLRRKGLYE